MYLKEIKAYGFKSFADKTNLIFGPNINAIVGPNGSGKSNVVDAIRFVLGEQSTKNLRGDNNMLDVIFSGSKSRSPLNSASVTLIFDNTDHHLPISFDEVSLKRVIYKTGENEYYLNNNKCRLKDITDLLTDSSASKESFNIISQGQISEILASKPTERRQIFEESAGVLKYKKRKEEALRKLEKTNENISRVNDIIKELDVQLEPLKRQSANAKKYLSLKEKLKDLEISLIVSEITQNKYEYEQVKEEIKNINEKIISSSTIINNNEAKTLKNKNLLKVKQEQLGHYQNELNILLTKKEQTNTSLKLLKERQKYELSSDEISKKTSQLKEEQLKNEEKLHNYQKEQEITTYQINELEESINTLTKNINQNNNEINTLNNHLRQISNQLHDLKYQKESLEERIANNLSLPFSVQKILNRKISGVHDILSNLITFADTYLTVFNVALASSSYYLVVDQPNTAKECINYLKENKIGRATFLPLNVMEPKYINKDILNEIASVKGYIAPLSDLVQYDKAYQNIILNQMGNILVVDNIDTANNISKIVNNRYKIITLDGQVINVGGSITGGNIQAKSNAVKDKYELANLNNQLELNNAKLKTMQEELEIKISKQNNFSTDLLAKQNKLQFLNSSLNQINISISDLEQIIKSSKEEVNGLQSNNTLEDKYLHELSLFNEQITSLNKEIEITNLSVNNLFELIEQLESEIKNYQTLVNKNQKELTNKEILANRIDVKVDNLLTTLKEEYNITFEYAKDNYFLQIDSIEATKTVNTLKEELKDLGIVNLGAIDEETRINERYSFLGKQKESLEEAINTLVEIITEMDEVMKDKFLLTFKSINLEFKKVFKKLFQGGEAALTLTDPNNILETGVEIEAVPAGKNLKSLSLLSGGEKTLTAIALLFAILNVNPVPFCIFDEVEAALDEANVDLFGNYLSVYKDKTQFILITHKKKTMEYADILYGITMQESGVSKLVSVRLEDIKK